MFRVIVSPYYGSKDSQTHTGFETYGQVSNFIRLLASAAHYVVEKNVDGVWTSSF